LYRKFAREIMSENRNGKAEDAKAPAGRRAPWQTPKLRGISAREAEVGATPTTPDGGFTTS
jgi:hypothetical protein